MKNYDTDVFVAGGGPAGLSAAIAARLAGFDVTLADRARPPIDKSCGEGILPQGLAALEQLGVRLPPEHVRPFRGVRFVDASGQAEAIFPNRKFGIGVRRTTLHDALVRRAQEIGVQLLWGARVESFAEDCVTVEGKPIRARWRVCADGQNSRLRAHAGLDAAPQARAAQRPDAAFPPRAVERLCRSVLERSRPALRDPRLGNGSLHRTHHAQPHLEIRGRPARFSGGGPKAGRRETSSPLIGGVSLSQRVRNVTSGNVALLGEAAGSVDPVTGAGLTIAFQEAVALADAMRAGKLSAYQSAHARISRLPHLMSRMLVSMDRVPIVRRRAFRAFAAQPLLFSALLAMHSESPPRVARSAREIACLGWHILTA